VVAFAVVTAICAATPRGSAAVAELSDAFIQRVVAQTTREVTLGATRELRAGMIDGRHDGWMRVTTRVAPGGIFSWEVLDEGGSGRTRDRVLRKLLDAEDETWRGEARDRSSITPANYHFALLDRASNGSVRIRLTPKRSDSSLVDGILTVDADGAPQTLEGRLARAPSFWVRSVTIVKQFDRIAGVALPVWVESLADLRFFGQATLVMRYHYHQVNGRRVSHVPVERPAESPSPEILALHAASRR
jgi:hypothetical protein